MRLVKFTAYDDLPIYVNPIYVTRVYQTEYTGGLTCIDIVGDKEEGTFFTVKEPIEKVIEILENADCK